MQKTDVERNFEWVCVNHSICEEELNIDFLNPYDVKVYSAWNRLDMMSNYHVAMDACRRNNLSGIMTREAMERLSVNCYSNYIGYLESNGEMKAGKASTGFLHLHEICEMPGHESRSIFINVNGKDFPKIGITIYKELKLSFSHAITPLHWKVPNDDILFIRDDGWILTQTIQTPVYIKDKNGKYLGCNKQFEECSGFLFGDLIGKNVYDILPKDLADDYTRMDQELYDCGGTQHYEYAIITKQGYKADVVFDKAITVNSNGEVSGIIGVISKKAEHNLPEESQRIQVK